MFVNCLNISTNSISSNNYLVKKATPVATTTVTSEGATITDTTAITTRSVATAVA